MIANCNIWAMLFLIIIIELPGSNTYTNDHCENTTCFDDCLLLLCLFLFLLTTLHLQVILCHFLLRLCVVCRTIVVLFRHINCRDAHPSGRSRVAPSYY